ncbi:MAG: DUF4249 family protein [Chitinophagales bacterium]|nr:DUF4249 family protein [Chitinophagales bacterium]MDW8419319.1 DUF4249 family protein [Chitinophagales bacterium]
MFRIYVLPFLALVCILPSCKQDFDLTARYEEVPIVYGLLNSGESTHYVRIQKGFLIDGNAYTAAAVNDSVYYTDSLLVQLKTLPGGPVYTLVKKLMPKEDGTFSSSQHYVYTCNANLDATKEYELRVLNTANGREFSAKTRLVQDFTINVPIKAQTLPLRNTNAPAVNFYRAPNAGVYDVLVRFPYLEYDATTNTLVKDTFIEYYLLRNFYLEYVPGALPVQAEFTANSLINALQNRLEKRSDRYREFNRAVGMTFKVSAGGSDFATYLSSKATQQTGISSNEALPPYTNIRGGYGIFSSRYFKQVDSVLLTNAALDTLACSPLSAGLRFRGSTQQICE